MKEGPGSNTLIADQTLWEKCFFPPPFSKDFHVKTTWLQEVILTSGFALMGPKVIACWHFLVKEALGTVPAEGKILLQSEISLHVSFPSTGFSGRVRNKLYIGEGTQEVFES